MALPKLELPPKVLLHVALLSGRSAKVHAAQDASVYQVKLDAGQQLEVTLRSLSRQDGTLLDERSTILDAELEAGETLQATVGTMRMELETQAIGLLTLLDSDLESAALQAKASAVEVQNHEELKHLFQLIMSTVLATPACAASCADLIQGLLTGFPDFQEDQVIRSRNVLLKVLQDDLEKIPIHGGLQGQKFRTGWVQLFSELVLRNLIPCHVINQALQRLTEPPDQKLPEESLLQVACELLEICGVYLEEQSDLWNRTLSHLARVSRAEENSCFVYADATRHRIQEILRRRIMRWNKASLDWWTVGSW